jgi:hypothetical protein
MEGQTDRGKTVYPSPLSGSGGIITFLLYSYFPYDRQNGIQSTKSNGKDKKLLFSQLVDI